MDVDVGQSFKPQRGDYALIALLLAGVYFGIGPQIQFPDRFALLADSLIEGQLTVSVSGFPDELIPASESGRYFVAYPPLPAFVLVPLRAAFGSEFGSRAACRLACVLVVLLFGCALSRISRCRIGPTLSKLDWYLWVLVLGFGTAVWDSATWAGDWHYAHALALALFMAATSEYFGRRRWWLVGCWVGLAVLARPTMAFTGVFFLFAAFEHSRTPLFKKLCKLAIGPVAAVAMLALYNAQRFGNPFDFGYDRMVLRGEGLALMNAYGQFHPAYILRNLFWFFAAPPGLTEGRAFPFLTYDPHGLSLLIASPIFALAFVAAIRRWRTRVVWSALIAIGVCLMPLLLYFNTGFAQFGHRFSMDYLPMLMLLAVVGAGTIKRPLWRGLIVASILIHVWGLMLVKPQHRTHVWRPEFIELRVEGNSNRP